MDIICKPNHKVLDLKITDEAVYVADLKQNSVVVSSIETSVLNFDPSVKITPQVDNYSIVTKNPPWLESPEKES